MMILIRVRHSVQSSPSSGTRFLGLVRLIAFASATDEVEKNLCSIGHLWSISHHDADSEHS
jgi:hypothetical protein